MLRYFYSLDDATRTGPVTLETLKALAVAGTLMPEHFVFVEGAADWVEARCVEGLFASEPAPAPTTAPASAATGTPRKARSKPPPVRMSEYAAKPRARALPIARGLYGPPEPSPLRYRAAAAVADLALLALALSLTVPAARSIARALWSITAPGSAPGGSLSPAGLATILTLIVIPWLYHAAFESSPWLATPGKRILDMRVVDARGERPSFTRATIRHFAKALSIASIGLGILWAWLDPSLRTWHDLASGTRILRTPQV